MKKGLSEIVIIADKSGSMYGTIEEARQSINRLIEEQKQVEGEAKLTFVMFDDQYTKIIDRQNLKEVSPIGEEYNAGGMTAMNDAIGKTIDDLGKSLALTPEEERPEKVIVAIITDGQENSSKEYTREKIAEMITLQKETYNWEFMFFGADIDVIATGTGIQIDACNIFCYNNTNEGIKDVYTTMSYNILSARENKEI